LELLLFSIQACTPFSSSRPGFISRDTETRVCYVTCHHPRNAEVFTVIRQACLRSLSCEVSPAYSVFIANCANSRILIKPVIAIVLLQLLKLLLTNFCNILYIVINM